MSIFNKGFQPYYVEIDDRTITYTAGNQRVPIPLSEKLPPFIRGDVGHFFAWHVDIIATPTFTTAPTIVGNNSVLNQFLYRAEGNRGASVVTSCVAGLNRTMRSVASPVAFWPPNR